MNIGEESRKQRYSPTRAIRGYAETFSEGEDILRGARELFEKRGNQGLAYKAKALEGIVDKYLANTQNYDEAAHQLELLYDSLAPMMDKASWKNAKGAKEMRAFLDNSLNKITEYANLAELNNTQESYKALDANSEKIPAPERVLSSQEYRRKYRYAAAGSDAIPILILNAKSGRRPYPTLRHTIGRHIRKSAEKIGSNLKKSASYILGAMVSLGTTFGSSAPTLENYLYDSSEEVRHVASVSPTEESQDANRYHLMRAKQKRDLAEKLNTGVVLGSQENEDNETYLPSEITDIQTQITSQQNTPRVRNSRENSYDNMMKAVRANIATIASLPREVDDGKTASPLWRKSEAIRDASLRQNIDAIMKKSSENESGPYFANILDAEMKDGILLPVYGFEILPESNDKLLSESLIEDDRTFGEIVGTFRDNLRMDAIAERNIDALALASKSAESMFPEYTGQTKIRPDSFELTPLELAEQTGINGLLEEQKTIAENQIKDYQEYILANGGVRPEFITSDRVVENEEWVAPINEEWVAPIIPQSFGVERAEDAMALRMRTPFSPSLVVDSQGRPIIQTGKPNLEGIIPLDGRGIAPGVFLYKEEVKTQPKAGRRRFILGAGDSSGESLFGNR